MKLASRTRRFAALAVSAVLLVLTAQHGIGASGSLSPSPLTVPNEKASAIAMGKAKEGKLRFESTSPGYLSPTADSGAAEDVTRIKEATVTGIDAIKTGMRLPANAAERAIAARSLPEVAARRAVLAHVLDPSVSGAETAEIEAAIATVAADPSYQAYQDNKFVVDQWQGVRINGDSALAVLLAHDTYLVGHSWKIDPVKQFQIEFRRAGKDWKIQSRRSIHLEDHGVTVPGLHR
jgi:hypothetical protein